MALKLKTKKDEFWVKMDENLKISKVDSNYQVAENEGMFFLSPLDPKEGYELVDSAVEHEWDNNQRFDKANWYSLQIGKIKKIIKDWRGMVNGSDLEHQGVLPGNPVPCNDYWKEQMYLCNQPIFQALIKFCDDYQAKKKKVQEDDVKNSPSGQNGSLQMGLSGTAPSAEKSTE